MAIGNKIKSRDAFSMLEVMVAFTILAVGILAIVPITVFMLQSNIHNKNIAQARLIAEQYAENFRAIDYENAILMDDGDTTDLDDIINPDFSDTVDFEGQDYVVSWNIATNLPSPGIKSVNIIVSWQSTVDDFTHRLDFLTYKAAVSR